MAQKAKTSVLFDAFAEDLRAERSARPLVIIGASRIDDLLGEMLRRFLLPKTAKVDDLLDGDTPWANFSARIKVCRRLGFIDESLYLAIDQLRKLRNLCAHSISFDYSRSGPHFLPNGLEQDAKRKRLGLGQEGRFQGFRRSSGRLGDQQPRDSEAPGRKSHVNERSLRQDHVRGCCGSAQVGCSDWQLVLTAKTEFGSRGPSTPQGLHVVKSLLRSG